MGCPVDGAGGGGRDETWVCAARGQCTSTCKEWKEGDTANLPSPPLTSPPPPVRRPSGQRAGQRQGHARGTPPPGGRRQAWGRRRAPRGRSHLHRGVPFRCRRPGGAGGAAAAVAARDGGGGRHERDAGGAGRHGEAKAAAVHARECAEGVVCGGRGESIRLGGCPGMGGPEMFMVRVSALTLIMP